MIPDANNQYDAYEKLVKSDRSKTLVVAMDKTHSGELGGALQMQADRLSISYEDGNTDGLIGLVKKTSAAADGKYTTDLTDKVNMHPYGKDDNNDDYIKFKIYDIVNKKYIIFRAFLSGISESVTPEWSSEKYIGRPDSVHVYTGAERSMSFEFMISPNTRQELPILWEKMNYLVGLAYPSWKTMGDDFGGKRMEAPFIQLTIGDMYNAVPGFLSSLSITVDDNSPWEIEEGFQLPHVVNVSCEFTHIGQHVLASQGKHYDVGWLKEYDQSTGKLGVRKSTPWKKFYKAIGTTAANKAA
jgi:hypothetical protein